MSESGSCDLSNVISFKPCNHWVCATIVFLPGVPDCHACPAARQATSRCNSSGSVMLAQVHVGWLEGGTAILAFRGTQTAQDGLQDVKIVRQSIDHLQGMFPGTQAHSGKCRPSPVRNVACSHVTMQDSTSCLTFACCLLPVLCLVPTALCFWSLSFSPPLCLSISVWLSFCPSVVLFFCLPGPYLLSWACCILCSFPTGLRASAAGTCQHSTPTSVC